MSADGKICLLNPGPVTLTPRVRQALLRPDLCHREPEYAVLQTEVRERLARVYPEAERDYSAVLVTGSGTAAVEAMVGSLVPRRGKALVVENGVYGERVSPDEALRTWGMRLTRAIPLDELLLQLAETLRKSMQLRSAQIWAGADGHYEVAAMVPHRQVAPYSVGDKERAVVSRAGVSGGTWLDIWLPGFVAPGATTSTRVAPIAHSGELLGMIACERAADAAPFTDDDDRVLTELARQVGLALHNVQLDTALQASLDELRQTNDELRASRVRIVAAGDAERRKLERNLHDGAQQHLVALAVKLRLAKDAVTDDPADAESMIDEIRGDLQDAIAELRALAHGIFPPLLMSGGLAEALPAAAARAALPTNAEIVVGRHNAEVEAAVYFCCMEALQNAGKHAGSTASAVVKVWEADRTLHWEVTDDGPGFDPVSSAGAGHGFVNMRDRMGSFGGSIDVVSAVGAGTTIRGHVPLDN
jgi:signal transduction histidine kinase